MDEPLADDLTRGQALRLGALFHDVGKPATRGRRDDGKVTFVGHDKVGEDIVTDVFRRLRTSERLRSFVGRVTREHLRLGFLVHQRPLQPRDMHNYLRRCQPVEVEVTLLSCADRMATAAPGPGEVDRRAPRAGPRGDGGGTAMARRGAAARPRCPATSWRGNWRWPRGPSSARCWPSSNRPCTPARCPRARKRSRSPGACARIADTMIIDCAVYDQGRRREGEFQLHDALKECHGNEAFAWIGLYEPTEDEFDSVRREFQLHELAVEDAIKAHQRPKLEVYGDMLFIVLKTARYLDSKEVVEFGEILVFLGDGLHHHGSARGGHRAARRPPERGAQPRAA